jgi:hypothetical protein
MMGDEDASNLQRKHGMRRVWRWIGIMMRRVRLDVNGRERRSRGRSKKESMCSMISTARVKKIGSHGCLSGG